MNFLNSPIIGNLLSSDIPRLCRSVPELVAVLTRLCAELSALRETLEEVSEKEKNVDE